MGGNPCRTSNSSFFVIDILDNIGVPLETRIFHIIDHDNVLNDIRRIGSNPKHGGRKSSRPEVNGGSTQVCMILEPSGENVICPPPNNKIRSEDHCRDQALVKRTESVVPDEAD